MSDFAIRPVLESYGADVPPRNSRSDWVPMRCPFHGDDLASASVNETSGRFMCHGCMQRSEDAVGLLQWAEDIGYREAVRRCEGIAGAGDGPVRKHDRGRTRLSQLFS